MLRGAAGRDDLEAELEQLRDGGRMLSLSLSLTETNTVPVRQDSSRADQGLAEGDIEIRYRFPSLHRCSSFPVQHRVGAREAREGEDGPP